MRAVDQHGPQHTGNAYFNFSFTAPEYRNRYAMNITLLSYRLPGEVLLTIPWINHRGSMPTNGLRGMKQAIDIALHNEVLNRLLLA